MVEKLRLEIGMIENNDRIFLRAKSAKESKKLDKYYGANLLRLIQP